jgi:Pyruvate/2-oxoacid:ferredoxin oxidoreductase delta subunit
MAFPVVNEGLCTACGICVDDCPSACFDLEDVVKFTRKDDCIECGICADSCPSAAITMAD